jgi:hypothetical protein
MRTIHTRYLIGEEIARTDAFWQAALADIHAANQAIVWPAGGGAFVICPEAEGNGVEPIKRAFLQTLQGRGWCVEDRSNPQRFDAVKYILPEEDPRLSQGLDLLNLSNRVQSTLEGHGLATIGALTSLTRHRLGALEKIGAKARDEVVAALTFLGLRLHDDANYIGVEWETGNVSSAHRSINRILLANVADRQKCIGGGIVLPTREMANYLTDRISNYEELEPYFRVWERLAPLWPELPLALIAIQHDRTSRRAPRIDKRTDGYNLLRKPGPSG